MIGEVRHVAPERSLSCQRKINVILIIMSKITCVHGRIDNGKIYKIDLELAFRN